MDNTQFHESTIVSVISRASSIEFEIEEARKNDALVNGIYRVGEVDGVFVEGVKVESLSMKHADGEILKLEQKEGRLTILVVWNDYQPRVSITECIVITGRFFTWNTK